MCVVRLLALDHTRFVTMYKVTLVNLAYNDAQTPIQTLVT